MLLNRNFAYFYLLTFRFFIVTVLSKRVKLSKSLIENVKSILSKPKNLKYLCFFFLFVTAIHPKEHEIYLWFIFHKKNNWQPLKNMTFAYFYLFTLRFFIDTVMGKRVKISKSLIENVRSIFSKLKNLINFILFFLFRRYTQKKMKYIGDFFS